jgi:hypothetical protein
MLKIAVKYDKNIPCGKNPLFLMQRERGERASSELQMVCSLIREPFRTNKDLNNSAKVWRLTQKKGFGDLLNILKNNIN